MPDLGDLPSLQRQLENQQEALLLIQERKSEYTLSTDIPLDLIREERETQEEIAALEAQIKALAQAKPPAVAAPTAAVPVARPKTQPAAAARGKTRSSFGCLSGVVVLVIVIGLLMVAPRLLNRGTDTSTKEGQPTGTLSTAMLLSQSVRPEVTSTARGATPGPEKTSLPLTVLPEATRADSIGASPVATTAAAASPLPAFAPATPMPTLTPPPAVNLTNNREGKYEKLALLFDQNDTLHLVFASPLLRSAGDYWHQQLSVDGAWTEPESLTSGFEGMWSNLELRPNAQGQLCVLWRGIDKAQGEGYYMRCQTGPNWLQQRVTQWRPKTSDSRAGFSAVTRSDGEVDAAFHRVGTSAIAFNDIPDIVQDHLAAVWYDVDLERDAAGNYHVLWERGGDPTSLEYRRSADGGRTWTETERLTSKADAPDHRYSLVADTQGAVHLVWQGFSQGIYYRRWTPEVGWSDTAELSQGVNGRSPQVAIDSQGLARIAWDGYPGVWYAAQAPDGSWPAPRLISSTKPGLDYGSIQIAVDAAGRSHVIWLHEKDIYYTVVE